MEEPVVSPMLMSFAKMVAEQFPILKGRSIAVSEVDLFKNKTDVPSLPLAFSALLSETSDQKASGGQFNIQQEILLQFMFESVKYTGEGGADTPFFAFYDYEAIRDRLLTVAAKWRTPRGGGLRYKSLDVSSDTMAVFIAFKFVVTEVWSLACNGLPDDGGGGPYLVTINSTLCLPQGMCDNADPAPTDPCAS